jgi:hypothetical protein
MKKRDRILENLRRVYKYFNDTYFNDQLRCSVTFAKINDDGSTQLMSDGSTLIKIHKDFRKHSDAAAIILLHEMVHVKLNQDNYKDTEKGHGLRFHAEIDRLYREGAYSLLL